MNNAREVVLPDTLVAQLIDNAATLSKHLQQDFAALSRERDALRARLIREQRVIAVSPTGPRLQSTYSIDGAHLAEIDRASAYSASCAVAVGQANQQNHQSSCLSILPHVACLNSLSSGLMMMQEIMMAVSVTEQHPDVMCLIDGSKISAIINLNGFYTGIMRDLPHQLEHWRRQAHTQPDREPGRTVALFERRDWLSPYLACERIVGNLKLVTTTHLVEQYAPTWIGRFDDKTFAALVLESGEALEPVPLPQPEEPYHVSAKYPFSNDVDVLGRRLTQTGDPLQVYHVYYRPDASHGVFKIELNKTLLNRVEDVGALLAWWRKEIDAPDLQEPYSFYIADRFAKEAVSVAKGALREIMRRDTQATSWAWFFTQAYRTE